MSQTITKQELDRRVDALMAQATQMQDEGRHADADTLIAEAQNLEDLFEAGTL